MKTSIKVEQEFLEDLSNLLKKYQAKIKVGEIYSSEVSKKSNNYKITIIIPKTNDTEETEINFFNKINFDDHF